MSCNICVEKFDRTTRSPVSCPFCKFICCRTCIETYVLSIKDFMNCMNCHKYFGRFLQADIFTVSFLEKKYRKHHSDILFEREKAYYGEAQNEIEREMAIARVREEIGELKRELDRKKEELNLMYTGGLAREKVVYTRKCSKSGCNGLVDSSWHCILCGNTTCSKCIEVRDEDHKCDPDAVKTASLLRADTKPCPKCGVLIYKISGCDQMFCVSCHCPFSWRTGKVEVGAIHNPHYYEWAKKNKTLVRNPADIQCADQIDHTFTSRFYHVSTARIRMLIHVREVDLPRFRVDVAVNTLRDRVRFLKGEVEEDAMRRALEKKDKEHTRNEEVYNVLYTFVQCATDIILRYRHKSKELLGEMNKELLALVKYVNERFGLISKKIRCVHYEIDVYSWKFGKKGK